MKFSFKFSNLLGTVYRQGDLVFTPDGNSVISPVGNRITIFDLKNNNSITLPIESQYNYNALDISPNGCTLIAINEKGDAHMISLISQTIVHKYRFKSKVNAVKFSPDGKLFAVCKESNVFVFQAPGPFTGQYNSFVMKRVFKGALAETTCLDWSMDSKVLAVGSQDNVVRLYPMEKWKDFKAYSLSSHNDYIVGCFFEENSLDLTTISRNGRTCIWECNKDFNDLMPAEEEVPRKKKKTSVVLEEDEIDITKAVEKDESELAKALEEVKFDDENAQKSETAKISFKRVAVHYLLDEIKKENKEATLTTAAYHKKTKILVTGYSTGAFFIHEMPEMNLIHSLSISQQKITTVALNQTCDWIALGCSGLGQLLVWEWQSETYVMKQQGHSNNMSCVSYSLDGQHLVTGGEDGKVKLWNLISGFCVVTFNEHTSPVTGVCFSGNKKFVASSSLDGTVRAFDLIRYRNFRTLTTPRLVQLSCVAVDTSGEFVAAGGQDIFEIFLWSIKTGRLLEVLSGHEGPVWSLAFTPSITSSTMASVSWDKTVRIWDALEKGSAHETIQLTADGLCVAFKPDGLEVAVATLDGQITIFDVKRGLQLYSIEGRNDLGSGVLDTDLVSAKQSLKAKSFTSLCYSADGECLLAGGQSKNVCIYNIRQGIIMKKFEITQNRSLDGVDDFINRRKLTEFGNVALVEERDESEGGKIVIKLPGVKKGDMSSRTIRPEVRVFSLQFSPTGLQWSAATTEGLLIYALNTGTTFDPWELQMGITPSTVEQAIAKQDHLNALTMAMRLNEPKLITKALENVPVCDIELVIVNLTEKFVTRLLVILASALESSNHLEYYLTWTQSVLTIHGARINQQQTLASLLALQKSLVRKNDQLSKICDFNKYTLQYIMKQGEFNDKLKPSDVSKDSDEDLEMLFSDEDGMETQEIEAA